MIAKLKHTRMRSWRLNANSSFPKWELQTKTQSGRTDEASSAPITDYGSAKAVSIVVKTGRRDAFHQSGSNDNAPSSARRSGRYARTPPLATPLAARMKVTGSVWWIRPCSATRPVMPWGGFVALSAGSTPVGRPGFTPGAMAAAADRRMQTRPAV